MPLQPVHPPLGARRGLRPGARRGRRRRSSAPARRCPSERRLAEVLGVSRPAVREALQRMAADPAGRGAPRRRDDGARLPAPRRPRPAPSAARARRRARRLGRPQRRWRPGWRSGPAVAALAAERGGPALAADADRDASTALRGHRRRRRAAAPRPGVLGPRSSTPPTRSVFRLMFNSLRAAYEPALEALAPLMAEEVGQVGAYRVLTAALGSGDPDTARAAADRVLRPATDEPAGRAGRTGPRACRGGPMTKDVAGDRGPGAADGWPPTRRGSPGQAQRRESLPLGPAWRRSGGTRQPVADLGVPARLGRRRRGRGRRARGGSCWSRRRWSRCSR